MSYRSECFVPTQYTVPGMHNTTVRVALGVPLHLQYVLSIVRDIDLNGPVRTAGTCTRVLKRSLNIHPHHCVLGHRAYLCLELRLLKVSLRCVRWNSLSRIPLTPPAKQQGRVRHTGCRQGVAIIVFAIIRQSSAKDPTPCLYTNTLHTAHQDKTFL